MVRYTLLLVLAVDIILKEQDLALLKMEHKIPPPEDRFHANVLRMTKVIRGLVQRANELGYKDILPFIVDVGTKYIDTNYDKHSLIEGFIECSHPFRNGKVDTTTWDRILEKDEEFFHEKALEIFRGIPTRLIEAFKKLYEYTDLTTGKSIITEEDREEIVMYFHSFVKISIKYIHSKRQPYAVSKDGAYKYMYSNPNYFEYIDVKELASKWKLNLEFTQIN